MHQVRFAGHSQNQGRQTKAKHQSHVSFGESRIEVSDGVNAIALGLTKNGIEALIGELQTVLDMAD